VYKITQVAQYVRVASSIQKCAISLENYDATNNRKFCIVGQDTIEGSLVPADIEKSDRSIVTLHSGRLGLISHGSDCLS